MELIVRNGAVEREIVLVETESGYEVHIGDRVHEVEVTHVGATGRSLVIDGRQHELGVRPLGGGRYAIDTPESTRVLEVLDPLSRLAEASRGDAAAEGAGRVTAYMPGRVVTVLVAAGDTVEAGQGVIVLEAMKMENEIQADRAGTVTKIHVDPGQSVDGGDPLFEVE